MSVKELNRVASICAELGVPFNRRIASIYESQQALAKHFKRRGEDPAQLEADAQALADVRTLDEWARKVGLGTWQLRAGCDGSGADRFIVWIKREATDADGGTDDPGYCDDDWWSKDFEGATPDEARAKAAAWVRGQAK